MIYGQSGGGSKVTTLLGMPSAAGLIHRASVQSGGGGNIPTGEQQKEFARQVVKELGIAPNDIAALQKMEWAKLIAAGNAVAAKMNPPMRGMFFVPPAGPSTPRVGWSPTLDGRIINVRALRGSRSGNLKERADADRFSERGGHALSLEPDRG